MRQPKKICLTIICLLWLGMSVFTINEIKAEAEEKESIENAKAGIVEIFSGVYDNKGNFRKLQSGSGFLIRNADDETYMITSRSIVTISDADKKEYCKQNKIKLEGSLPETVIKVIVKGDVSIEAEIVTESEEKDFSILSTPNVINEKNALKLENNRAVSSGDVVYALGFPEEENIEYIPTEVECSLGTVETSELNWKNILHIQHTAHLNAGCIGGPLLNEVGYVVGVNYKKILENGTEIYCTLPIEEIIEVLDNFSIYYESSLRDYRNMELERLYTESIMLYESKDYKKESLEAFQAALTEVAQLSEKSPEEVEITEIEQAYKELEAAKQVLVPKLQKIQIVIYVLAGVIALLFLWLMVLLILKLSDKKKGVQMQGVQSQMSQNQTAWKQKQQGQILQHQDQFSQYQQKDSTMQAAQLALIHPRTGQAQTISDRKMVVGKSLQKADFSIADNNMVSREHAAFQQQNGRYYVCDLNSMNGTFVNGNKIPAESYVEIKAGDIIVLADERFELR